MGGHCSQVPGGPLVAQQAESVPGPKPPRDLCTEGDRRAAVSSVDRPLSRGLTGHHLSIRIYHISLMFSFLCSLRLFQKFDTFRILVCGGDGSVGWVLSEIDSLSLHKQVHGCGGASLGKRCPS